MRFKHRNGIRHLMIVHATARLLRTPLGFAVVATVALATASCTIVAALVDAALLRNPPFREADRLAVVYVTRLSPQGGLTRQRWSFPRFQLLQVAAQPALFTQLASFTRVSALSLSDGGEAEPIEGEVVSASYFPLLSVTPLLGRSFATDEPDGSRRAEVIIGYDLWQRRFGAERTVLGKRVALNGMTCAIVGVMPRDFRGLTGRAELWMRPGMAASITYADYLTTNQNFISVAGRLAPGVTLERATAALRAIGTAIDRAAPTERDATGDRFSATALSLNQARIDPSERQWVLLLAGAVGFLFLLACANVSNLLIVRALARRRELAIRAALGASPMTIARAVAGEGVGLVMVGGAAGAAIAALVLPALVMPARLIAPRNMYGSIGAFADPAVDARFLALAVGIALLATIACALLPTFLPRAIDLTRDLKDGAPSTTASASPRRLTMRSLIVAIETALALMLLVAGGLMVESYRRLRSAPLGFEPEHLLTFWIMPPDVAYPPARAPALIDRVLSEIGRVPGVVAASVDGCTPVNTGCANSTLYVAGRPQPRPEDAPPVLRHYVAPEHFRTLGVPLLGGRIFDAGDRAGRQRVAIINRLAVTRFFPNENPIGKRVWFGGGSSFDRPDSAAEIVGIVGDVAYQSLDERPMQPDFYTPYAQFTYAARAVIVRSLGDPAALVPAIRAAVARAAPGVALREVRTMEEQLAYASAGRRFDTMLLAAFASIALLLAAMGIYAVVAHGVAQRTREVGIRIALGARPLDLVAMVIRDGMTIPAIGLAAGLVGSLALTRVLRSALYGVSATNPGVYMMLTAVLAVCGVAACYVPARRAAKVDPLVALKS
jgi:putative ABC transport system permease protein